MKFKRRIQNPFVYYGDCDTSPKQGNEGFKKTLFFYSFNQLLKKKLWYLTIPLHLSVRQVSSKDYDSRDI